MNKTDALLMAIEKIERDMLERERSREHHKELLNTRSEEETHIREIWEYNLNKAENKIKEYQEAINILSKLMD